MFKMSYSVSWLVIGLAIVALALAACGDDDDDQPEAPPASPVAAQDTPDTSTPAPTRAPVTSQPIPTLTPYLPPEDGLLQQAAAQASSSLADRLNIALDAVTVLDPDTALLLSDPLLCPLIERQDVNVYYVYLQHERFIYPYQFYALPPDAGGEVVVEACDDVLVDEEVLFIPTPNARSLVVALVKNDLQGQGIDPEAGEYVVQQMTWTDSALNCLVDAEEEVTSMVVEGYRVNYTLDGASYEYHTDATGERIEYCEPPIGYASIDAFLFVLGEDMPQFFEITDETVRYDGLDAEGELLLLTPSAWRVGLFQFDTPNAVRLAAAQIDDERVSRIFVSGYVLFVQEENDLEVYNILRAYAEEVRSPVLERQNAQIATFEAQNPTLTPPATPGS